MNALITHVPHSVILYSAWSQNLSCFYTLYILPPFHLIMEQSNYQQWLFIIFCLLQALYHLVKLIIITILYCYYLGYMHCISFQAIHVNFVTLLRHQKCYREKKKQIQFHDHSLTAKIKITIKYSVCSQKPDFIVATNDPGWRVIYTQQ